MLELFHLVFIWLAKRRLCNNFSPFTFLALFWNLSSVPTARALAGCSYYVSGLYPPATLTVGPPDTELWQQVFEISVVPGYTCPGSMIIYPTLFIGGELDLVPAGTFVVPTGTDVFTANFADITIGSLAPQIVTCYAEVTYPAAMQVAIWTDIVTVTTLTSVTPHPTVSTPPTSQSSTSTSSTTSTPPTTSHSTTSISSTSTPPTTSTSSTPTPSTTSTPPTTLTTMTTSTTLTTVTTTTSLTSPTPEPSSFTDTTTSELTSSATSLTTTQEPQPDPATTTSQETTTTVVDTATPAIVQSATDSTTASAESGLTEGDKIALGCGIGIGFPAAIATIVMCILQLAGAG